jgi:hypothetical protein
VVAGVLALAVIVVGVLVLAGQEKKGTPGDAPTAGQPPSVASTPPPPPTPPPPEPGVPPPSPAAGTVPAAVAPPPEPAPGSPEAEARRKAREDLERKEKQVASEVRATHAAKALEEATEFARNNSDDRGRVVRRYREVVASWKGTDAAAEAQRRADGVEKGELHPHPDRTFASKTAVDAAREALAANLPKIEAAIAARRYDDVASLVPDPVDDPAGTVTEELSFWRGLGKNLTAFTRGLKKEVETLPAADRTVRTAKGVLPVRTATDMGLQVERDSDLVDLRWVEIEPAALAELATKAFLEKDYAEPLAAFAWAHRLDDLFYQAVFALSDVARERSAGMEARAEARFKR